MKQNQESKNNNLLLSKWLIISLTAFFFISSLAQLLYVQHKVSDVPEIKIQSLLDSSSLKISGSFKQEVELIKLKSFVKLETHLIQRRYHQANILLMSRVWISYLSFVTGMILSFVGASFILSRVIDPTTKFEGELNTARLSVASSSPGIILSILGTTLILVSILTNHKIDIVDASVFLTQHQSNIDGLLPETMIQKKEKNTATKRYDELFKYK